MTVAAVAEKRRFADRVAWPLNQGWVSAVLLFGLFIAAWQLYITVAGVSALVFPGPRAVVEQVGVIWETGALRTALWYTSYALAVGFSLGVVAGLLLGLLLGVSRKADLLAQPYLWAAFATPDLAFVPLVILWLGFGDPTKYLMVFIGVVGPMTIAVRDGVRTIDESRIRAAVSFCAGRSELYRDVILPAIVPSIANGVRNGISRGFAGVLVVEMTVGTTGLGRQVIAAMARIDTAQMLAYIAVLIVLASILISSSKALERYASRWREEVSV